MHQFRNPVYSRLLKKLSSIFVLFSGEGVVVHRLQFAKIRLCFTKSKTLKISSGKKGRLQKGKGDWGFKKGDQRGEGKGNWLWELIPPVNPVSSVIYINVGDETVTDCLWLHSHTICNSYSGMNAYPIFDSPFKRLARRSPPGGYFGYFFAGYVPLASQSLYPIIVYSVANYRPHLSHFWANMEFSQSQLSNFLFMYLP